MKNETRHHAYYNSPLGWLEIQANDKAIVGLNFVTKKGKDSSDTPLLRQCIEQLDEYFSKKRKDFSLPMEFSGTTFQQTVWRGLQDIPFGQTRSYGELARAVKKPKAARAVGGANNKNRLPILIPCHRVIGGDGSMVGFACGVDKKEWLLRHEGSL